MTTTAATTSLLRPPHPSSFYRKPPVLSNFHSLPLPQLKSSKFVASASSSRTSRTTGTASVSSTNLEDQEKIFFDGGAHYGDLVSNLLLGFTLLWLPLTLAAVSRALFLRYRFTNKRVSVISGFTGQDRSDFPYSSIKDVKVVPRFIGEWGDIVITLVDGTVVDLRSVPRFREIADYCMNMKAINRDRGRGQGRGRGR
ncbi:NAD(P)-linked oxidoreductase superfamily protein [Rhynchospora pubera]|uniref:NAD(P)-linked oxidoreductase superfamily protein n=1 Tax=Rhynchospora pubera TaxID=906938 RepID=A0AAV8DJG6_9POAL|nr:NAD(P)-linked oxidoreductase superfamily protein [Rhynchospora pubera]